MKYSLILVVIIGLTYGCKTPEARRPISSSGSSSINESIERNKKLIAQEEEEIKALIAQDSVFGFKASQGGFWYAFKVQDTTETKMPTFGDIVEYDYSINTLGDKPIYTMAETPTKSYAMDQEQLASGIREGLKLTTAGDEIILLLPSHKAYGYYGDKNKIGQNLPIKVEIKVKSITTQK